MTVLLAQSREALGCFWHTEALAAQTGTVEYAVMLSVLLW